MSDRKEDKTLEEVIEEYANWEQEQKAYEFGATLWDTAKKAIELKKPNLRENELVNSLFSDLNNRGILTLCLTDTFRERVVRLHARGLSTIEVVKDILDNDSWQSITPFYVFKFSCFCGYDNIKKFLVNRLGYLKRTHARFPVKKYGEVWKEERASFLEGLREIPLANPLEQLHELTDHYQKLKVLFDESSDPKDKERYHKCMMRTQAAIHLVGRDPSCIQSSGALTQEKRPQALPAPNTDNELEFDINETKINKSKTTSIV